MIVGVLERCPIITMDCLYLVTHLILYNLYEAIIPADHVKHD